MKRIGVFLGVGPANGGMFQYAQSILDALRILVGTEYEVRIAYVDRLWEPILTKLPLVAVHLHGGSFGLRIADIVMAARLSGPIARGLSSALNPIPRQLKQLECDIWIFPGQDALAYQIRLPVVATVHDLMHRYESRFPEVSANGRYRIREHRFKNLTNWAKAILVDSTVGQNHVVESYGTARAKVHPLPYIPPGYIGEAQQPADFDSRYNLPKKFLFYPAQFWAHKNHQTLISAAAKVLPRCPDLFLVFSGGKSHSAYQDVLQHARALGIENRIAFVGFVPDSYLAGFYRRARALIMPTFFGPTNIPPLEAFVCGCPVAVSDIYGMREQSNGAALLFNPTSTEEIAAVIERLWRDDGLCATLSERGLAIAKSWGLQQFSQRLGQILAVATAGPHSQKL